jgi:peptidyl-prolyl cis-trans isomerase A (cyclophilin A)
MSRSSFFALLLTLSSIFVAMPSQAQTYACFQTNMGEEFCIKFLRDDAPNTVNNFINYVNKGAFDQTFIHRADSGYDVQGGGYKYEPVLGEAVPEDAVVANEFKVSNTRGTVAMAKLPNQADSATTEWFINLGDNASTLDVDNGGYTVFATVVKGMRLIDAIGNSLRVDLSESLGEVFTGVPVLRKDADGVGIEDLVQIKRVYLTNDVVEDPDPAVEAENLYQCTASWVSDIAPREVCMESNMGNFCMDLMPEVASKTVANFLHYVADGDYDNTFIQRSEPGFVVQGGGVRTVPMLAPVPSDPAVENEYSTPNTRGTVALAKLDGDPNSGTNQWFVNLADNTDILGTDNNGGFTVFAKVRDADMAVFDQIAALERMNLASLSQLFGAFGAAPMLRTSNPEGLSLADFVVVKRAYIPGHEINPCVAKPGALTELADRSFTLPVRMPDGGILEFRFEQQYVDGAPVFRPTLWRVRALKDVGQDTATYDGDTGLLTIPSVYVPGTAEQVFYNVKLRMIPGSQELDFMLESYDTPPETARILIPTP